MAYVSIATTSMAERSNIAVARPANVESGHILLATIYTETSTITAPSGWERVYQATVNGLATWYMQRYWLRAGGSEPSSYQWTHSLTWCAGAIAAYSGRIASGDPVDFYTTASGLSTTATAPSGTASQDDTDLEMAVFNDGWPPGTWSSWSSPLTERADFDAVGIGAGAQATAGSTGAKSATATANNYWHAGLIGLLPDTGVAATPQRTLFGVGT